jgi:hypothetical protein
MVHSTQKAYFLKTYLADRTLPNALAKEQQFEGTTDGNDCDADGHSTQKAYSLKTYLADRTVPNSLAKE